MTLSSSSGTALKWTDSAFVLGNTAPHAAWIEGIDALIAYNTYLNPNAKNFYNNLSA